MTPPTTTTFHATPLDATVHRRQFLAGSAALAALVRAPRVHSMAFAAEDSEGDGPSPANDNIVLTVFLRGGADFLNLVVPGDGEDRGYYDRGRPQVGVPANELLPLGDSNFGLHPSAAPLHDLYDDGVLAIVQGAGLPADTRSHFDAMSYIERGVTQKAGPQSGWLARHLATSDSSGAGALLPALAMGSTVPTSFVTNNDVVTLRDLGGFGFPGEFFSWVGPQRGALRKLYSADDSALHRAGIQALDGSNVIELNATDEYRPRAGVEYPNSGFGSELSAIAQVLKLDVGLRAATIDLGGWDTHNGQGAGSGGTFSSLVGQLSEGLSALYRDLDGPQDRSLAQRTTVVVMSEFGRRVVENSATGTDHGHGGAMLLLGGEVIGGLHGRWPGLASDQLYDSADVAVTVDYRQVIGELLVRRFGNPRLGAVLPDFNDYEPLGLVEGDDLDIDDSPFEPAESLGPPGEEQAGGVAGPDTGSGLGTGLLVGGVGAGAAATAGGLLALRRRRSRSAAPLPPVDPTVPPTTPEPSPLYDAPRATDHLDGPGVGSDPGATPNGGVVLPMRPPGDAQVPPPADPSPPVA